MAHGFNFDNSDYESDPEDGLDTEEEELNQEVFIETGLPDMTLRNWSEQYTAEGISGIRDGYYNNVLTLKELQNAMRHTLQSARYTELCRQRIDKIINNYRFVIMHILYVLAPYRAQEKFKILNNYIRLLSFNNRMYNYQRGILRIVVFRKGVGFRIILAIPPRHSCFGYTASQINFTHCVDAFPAYEYNNRVEKGIYEDMNHSVHMLNIGWHWWVLEFTLTQTDYLQFTDIFDILIHHQDINLLYSKPIFSWRSALDDIASYINIIWNKHEEITGSPYTERKTSSQKNARHRKKNKRLLQANGIALVR